MRITPDTTLDELFHSDVPCNDELYHIAKKGEARKDHKYIKREWKNGRWNYFYKDDLSKKNKNTLSTAFNNAKTKLATTVNKTKTNINNAVDKVKVDTVTAATKTIDNVKTKAADNVNKAVDKTLDVANQAPKLINKVVDKGKEVINKLYDDPNNMYDLNSDNYDKKMAQIKETKEWQDIVARSDPEYVKKNEDGTTTYLIDDYVVDKKFPILDVIGDIAAGRETDTNEITKDSTIAGLKQFAFGYVRTGALAAGVLATVMTEKFKLSQGSYDDEIEQITKKVTEGADYTKELMDDAKAITTATAESANRIKTIADGSADIAKDGYDVDPKSVEKLAKAVREGQIAAEAARSVNDGNVVAAAQIILQSETMKSMLGDNEYYKMVENTISNLTPAEQEAVAALVRTLRK